MAYKGTTPVGFSVAGNSYNDLTNKPSIGGTTITGDIKAAIVDIIYPVGSIMLSVNSANPGLTLGGTWVQWGQGRVPVGVHALNANFNTVEKTGGEEKHTLTQAELPAANMPLRISGQVDSVYSSNGGTATGTASMEQIAVEWKTTAAGAEVTAMNRFYVESGGSGAAHNNLQPYITCYMWKRTA